LSPKAVTALRPLKDDHRRRRRPPQQDKTTDIIMLAMYVALTTPPLICDSENAEQKMKPCKED
jgi:hypothetical protein